MSNEFTVAGIPCIAFTVADYERTKQERSRLAAETAQAQADVDALKQGMGVLHGNTLRERTEAASAIAALTAERDEWKADSAEWRASVDRVRADRDAARSSLATAVRVVEAARAAISTYDMDCHRECATRYNSGEDCDCGRVAAENTLNAALSAQPGRFGPICGAPSGRADVTCCVCVPGHDGAHSWETLPPEHAPAAAPSTGGGEGNGDAAGNGGAL